MRAVFFDLDGTLLDTVPEIRRTLNETLSRFSLPPVSPEEARRFVGNGAKKLIERATPEGAPRGEILADFRARYAESDNTATRPYDGAAECLSFLKERGCLLAVITNKPQEATGKTLSAFFPAGTFDFVGGDDGSFPVKPDPALTRYAALTLRVPMRECVFVGDGETDILTATGAEMRPVAALWGYRSREELAAAGAREFAEDFFALRKILTNF